MQVMVILIGICAAALLAWYVFLLMKGEEKK